MASSRAPAHLFSLNDGASVFANAGGEEDLERELDDDSLVPDVGEEEEEDGEGDEAWMDDFVDDSRARPPDMKGLERKMRWVIKDKMAFDRRFRGAATMTEAGGTVEISVVEAFACYKDLFGHPVPRKELKLAADQMAFAGMAARDEVRIVHRANGFTCVQSTSKLDEKLSLILAKENRPIPVNDIVGYRNWLRYTLPDHMLGPGSEIEPFKMPDHVKLWDFVDVTLSHCTSPEDFYVHLKRDHSRVDDLMDALEAFYCADKAKELTVGYARKDMIGLPVAAIYSQDGNVSDGWHRAVILEFLGFERVLVRYVDYGSEAEISLSLCRFLHSQFAQPPAFAARAKMSGLAPPPPTVRRPGEDEWPAAATGRLFQYGSFLGNAGYGFSAMLTGSRERNYEQLVRLPDVMYKLCTTVHELVLFDTVSSDALATPEKYINLNQAMLDEKLAVQDYQSMMAQQKPWEEGFAFIENDEQRRQMEGNKENEEGASATAAIEGWLSACRLEDSQDPPPTQGETD